MFKRRETIIFLLVTTGIIALTLLQLNTIDFIYSIAETVLYLIFIGTFIYAIVRLVRDKRKISFVEKAKPILLGVLSTAFFFVLSFLANTDGGKKRLITGGFNHDIHFIHFQLFSDNTFKLINSGPFGGPIARGTYSLQNDTLLLNNNSLRYLSPTLTFVLKESDRKQKYFEPVDSTKIKDNLFIETDNR